MCKDTVLLEENLNNAEAKGKSEAGEVCSTLNFWWAVHGCSPHCCWFI